MGCMRVSVALAIAVALVSAGAAADTPPAKPPAKPAATAPAAATPATTAASATALTGVQSVEAAWRKALLSNDLNAVVACYDKDAIFWFADTPEAKGQETIREAFGAMMHDNRFTAVSLTGGHYETNGGLSTGWGRFSLTLSAKAGATPPVIMTGRYTAVAKQAGGRWVFSVDHLSSDPGPMEQ